MKTSIFRERTFPISVLQGSDQSAETLSDIPKNQILIFEDLLDDQIQNIKIVSLNDPDLAQKIKGQKMVFIVHCKGKKRYVSLLYSHNRMVERFAPYTADDKTEQEVDRILIETLKHPKLYYVPLKFYPVGKPNPRQMATWRALVFQKTLENPTKQREEIVDSLIKTM